jgi:hypothetical protein
MLNKSIQLKLDFDFNVTTWVPEAKENKPMPQVNITFNVATDDLRLNSDRTQDLIDGLVKVIHFLEENKNVLDEKVIVEQQKWLELCQKRVNGIPKIFELQKQA